MHTDTAEDDPEPHEDIDITTDSGLPEISCTLSEAESEERLEWVRDELLPHLISIEQRDDGYTFEFERSHEAYEAVAEVAWKESQCCSWATFEVELPPGEGQIRWHEWSDREEGTQLFGDALTEIRRQLEGAPPIE